MLLQCRMNVVSGTRLGHSLNPGDDFRTIAASQPGQSGGEIAGEVVYAPVLEANSALRVGGFGKKNQFASLLDFAALAYLIRTTRCAILANAVAPS